MFTTVTNAEEIGLSFHEGCKTLKMLPVESSLFDLAYLILAYKVGNLMLNFQYRQNSNISYNYWNTASANNRAIECMLTTVTNTEEIGLSFHEVCKTLKMYPADLAYLILAYLILAYLILAYLILAYKIGNLTICVGMAVLAVI